MKHLLSFLLLLSIHRPLFGQTKWLAQWGLELNAPKYPTFRFDQQYIYLPSFGSFYTAKPEYTTFQALSDLGAYLRIKKDRKVLKANLVLFNESFNISDGSIFTNLKSYTLKGQRNGLRTGLMAGYRIIDRSRLHVYLSAGGTYDITSFRSDYNPINFFLNTASKSDSYDILIEQNYFLDRLFTIPRIGLLGSIDIERYNNVFSLIYEYRDPGLNSAQTGPLLFKNVTTFKLQVLIPFGYTMQ